MDMVFDILYYLKIITLPEIRRMGIPELEWIYKKLVERRKDELELQIALAGWSPLLSGAD